MIMRKMMKADFLAHQSSALKFLKTFNSFLTNHLNTFKVQFFSGTGKAVTGYKV